MCVFFWGGSSRRDWLISWLMVFSGVVFFFSFL